jgi:hypothetical protein
MYVCTRKSECLHVCLTATLVMFVSLNKVVCIYAEMIVCMSVV